MKKLFVISTSIILWACPGWQAHALDNGLAKTPPMGWNSWNCFAQNINEAQIKEIADVMVSSGMKDAGYVYLNLDDNWMATSRDANGNIRPDPTRFPGGMKALGDYIHGKGLKFGIYGDRGTETCYFRDNMKELDTKSGSTGREMQDAKTFASWGVDYLKYDNCLANAATMQKDYERMRDALDSCGRDIVFSICAWEFQPWMANTGNLWRTTTDILNIWKKTSQWSWGISDIIDLNEQRAPYAKPGAWNDPDMLQVGNSGTGSPTETEYRSHMSMWCIMAAPLIAGNDIRKMNQATKDILLNKEVIAIDQDSAGIQGRKISAANDLEVWCKPLGTAQGSEKAVALFNKGSAAVSITVKFSEIGLAGTIRVRDLWAKADRGDFSGSYSMSVPSHGAGMLKIGAPTAAQFSEVKRNRSGFDRFVVGHANGNLLIAPSGSLRRFDVSIFSSDGRCVARNKKAAGCVSLPVRGSGVYVVLVTCDGYRAKRVVLFYK